MTWKEIEGMFNRALAWTFSRKKLTLVVPVLVLCGLISVCFRVLGARASDWQVMSMLFLPIFFCVSILLSLGVVLIRVYHDEVKGLPISYRSVLYGSRHLMIEIAYLALPMILIYLVLWTLLGLFYLVKELPWAGDTLGLIFSFGPFLVFLGFLCLALLSLMALFFVTPVVALKSSVQWEVLKGIWERLKWNPFFSMVLLLLSVLMLLIVVCLMWLSAVVTSKSYVSMDHSAAIGIQWFFMMLPFAALIAPAVIFFFNFATEAHILMVKKRGEQ